MTFLRFFPGDGLSIISRGYYDSVDQTKHSSAEHVIKFDPSIKSALVMLS